MHNCKWFYEMNRVDNIKWNLDEKYIQPITVYCCLCWIKINEARWLHEITVLFDSLIQNFTINVILLLPRARDIRFRTHVIFCFQESLESLQLILLFCMSVFVCNHTLAYSIIVQLNEFGQQETKWLIGEQTAIPITNIYWHTRLPPYRSDRIVLNIT